jgi:hypothetical protein
MPRLAFCRGGPKRPPGVKEASQDMTTKEGQLTWAAKRARGMANSMEANERRRRREPPIIDWDEAIANLLDILDDTSLLAPPRTFRRR